jgi:hypothetical protein
MLRSICGNEREGIDMPKLIISTVGTTLLKVRGVVSADEEQLLTKHANDMHPPETLRALLDNVADDARYTSMDILQTAEFATLQLYRTKVAPQHAHWYLPGARYVFVGTDTYTSKMVLATFRRFLNAQFPQVSIGQDIVVRGLQVQNTHGLDTALRELYDTLNRATEAYDASDVLCNISGGFKFISGWMQAYAVHKGFATVYTFEGSQAMVLSEPRFPGNFPPPLEYI